MFRNSLSQEILEAEARDGNLEAVKQIVQDHGIGLGLDGAFFCAAEHGRLDVIEYLDDLVDHSSREDAITVAVENDHVEVVSYFLDKSYVDVGTIIGMASSTGSPNVIDRLLKQGVDDILKQAIKHDSKKVIQHLMLKHHLDPRIVLKHALLESNKITRYIIKHHLSRIKELIY